MLCTPRMGRHRSSAVSWSLAFPEWQTTPSQCGERYSFVHLPAKKKQKQNDWKGLKGYEYEVICIWSEWKGLQRRYFFSCSKMLNPTTFFVFGPDHWSGLSQEDEGWRCTHVRQDRCLDATSLFQTSDIERDIERVWRAKSHDDCCANVLGTTFQQIKTSTTWKMSQHVTRKCHWITYSKCHLSNLCHLTWDVPAATATCRNVLPLLPRKDRTLGAKLHLRRIVRKVCRKVQDCAEDAAFVPQMHRRCRENVAADLSSCIVSFYRSWSFYIFLLNFPFYPCSLCIEKKGKLGIEQAVLRSFKYNSPFEEVLPTGTTVENVFINATGT